MHRGYIAIYRKIEDHPFYKERREFSKLEAWIDILMQVQHSEKPIKVLFGMKVIVCNYGESLNSVLTWAKRWHWSESKVRRYFKLLSNLKQVEVQSEVQTTRLIVLNYSKYDLKRRASDEQAVGIRRAFDEHSTTDNNVKHFNNEKKVIKKNTKKKPCFKKYLDKKISDSNFNGHAETIISFYNYRMTEKIKGKYQRYSSERGINGLFNDLIECESKYYDISKCIEATMNNEWLTPRVSYFDQIQDQVSLPYEEIVRLKKERRKNG